MRVHPNQINPNAQLNALDDLQKAAAKRETDRVRKKLLNSASEIEADSDSYVANLGAHEESREQPQEQPGPQGQEAGNGGKALDEQAGVEEADDSISDWA